jgi:hypothetical protein
MNRPELQGAEEAEGTMEGSETIFRDHTGRCSIQTIELSHDFGK